MVAQRKFIGSAAIPEAEHSIPPTTQDDLDAAVKALDAQKQAWAKLDLPGRIHLLSTLRADLARVAPRWVDEALKRKRIPEGSGPEAEEWLAGPFATLRNLRLLERTLTDIQRDGKPKLPHAPTTRPSGQVAVKVFPTDGWDKALYSGIEAEVWLGPEVKAGEVHRHMAEAYRGAGLPGKVALVLGAGNVSSIGPMDALYKLFAENQVVVLKMNPVNEYIGPFIEEAFSELIRRGFLRVVYGGGAVGAYLSNHPLVEEIHITGSDKTHDAIVYGTGEEGRRNKEARKPINSRRITSELGNVSPVIVVPGPWTQSDFEFQARKICTTLANNAGFNCNATRVILTHQEWVLRQQLLASIRQTFDQLPTRFAYYPGAADRMAMFTEAHPEAEQIGDTAHGRLPWTFIPGVDPAKREDICLTTEAWTTVFSEAPISAATPAEFLDRAVKICNETIWGTLNAAILVHPKSLEDAATKAAFERAIENLRYGSVAINEWPALAYGFVSTPWGAAPGHELHDIGSGIGVVHNAYLFDAPQKTVVRAPFTMFPRPPWHVLNRTAPTTARLSAEFEAEPSLLRAAKLAFSAMRG